MIKVTKRLMRGNEPYNRCPECARLVIKEYPAGLHSKCLNKWAKKEIDALPSCPACEFNPANKKRADYLCQGCVRKGRGN
jgi:hypothetical protein